MLAVAEGRSVETVRALAGELASHGCSPELVSSMSIDMSPGFIKGCGEHLPNARITVDKFHAAKRSARGFTRMSTIRTFIFLVAGKLDFRAVNPHVA